jgi:hypothetical protein
MGLIREGQQAFRDGRQAAESSLGRTQPEEGALLYLAWLAHTKPANKGDGRPKDRPLG